MTVMWFLSLLFLVDYERGWPSYFIAVRRRKNVGGRGVQKCVWKLAANASD